jgi:cytochrome c biogenesis protein CcdA
MIFAMNRSMDSVAAPTINHRLTTFLHAVLFVLGFSLVFIVGWGGAATAAGQLFGQYKTVIGQVGGLVVIVFGLVSLGVLKIPWLYYDTRRVGPNRQWVACLRNDGVFFAAGWCSMYWHDPEERSLPSVSASRRLDRRWCYPVVTHWAWRFHSWS